MLSLDNAYTEEELRAFDERVRKGAGLGDAAGRLRRRDEDRRPEHRPDLRGRTADPRRDARRRRARRRRDGQRPHDSRDSAGAARRAARAHRSARRGLPARARRSNGSTANGRRPASELYANPRNSAAGTMRNLEPGARREAGARRVHLSGGRGRGPVRRAHSETLAAMRTLGAARRAALAEVRGRRRAGRVLPGMGREAADPQLRHRRRRHQGGRRWRCAPGSARPRSFRAGRPRSSFRPSRPTPGSCGLPSTSAGPAP